MLARPICSLQHASAYRLALKKRTAPSRATGKRSIASSAVARFEMRQDQQQGSTTSPASFLLLFAGTSSFFVYRSHVQPLRCEPTTSAARPYAEPHTPAIQGPGSSRLAARRKEEPPVESSLDLRSLSFGAVAGISTGVFVKKGLKAVGFLLGGAFVFLQYMASRGLVNVDWRSMARR
ncbi:MAG: hypothetical protein CYPHOPRED_001773 [Cyphobasidiales sp. Tagirdzhanova-0007]|nr:MAG: hypothetical protein CYPHOPRED_001773 [Cyphobasidiales sp. Tagirdzhanova-0007]